MAQRTLELTLISAKDLKDVNLLSKMEVYAVVSLSGDPRSRQRIQADRTGGRNPTWNATLRFTVPASDAGSLHVLLRAERALGEVHIPLSELLNRAPDGAVPAKFVAYQVRKINSGKPQGVLNFSYKLGEVTKSNGYTPASASASYATRRLQSPDRTPRVVRPRLFLSVTASFVIAVPMAHCWGSRAQSDPCPTAAACLPQICSGGTTTARRWGTRTSAATEVEGSRCGSADVLSPLWSSMFIKALSSSSRHGRPRQTSAR